MKTGTVANLASKVVLIDLDNTLTMSDAWTVDECLSAVPKEDMIKKVAEIYQKSFVVIYTARRDENMPATLEWLRRNNVRYHAISNIKCAADVYVDDKMMSPKNFIGSRRGRVRDMSVYKQPDYRPLHDRMVELLDKYDWAGMSRAFGKASEDWHASEWRKFISTIDKKQTAKLLQRVKEHRKAMTFSKKAGWDKQTIDANEQYLKACDNIIKVIRKEEKKIKHA